MNIKKNWYIVAIVLGVAALFGLIGSCCMWRTEETITVTSLRWETTVYIEELQPQHYNHKDYLDPDAYNVTSWTEYDPPTKTMKKYYSYTVDEWRVINSITKSGTRNENIKYADVYLKRDQKATSSVDFTVGYKNSDGKLKAETVSENIWRSFPNVGKKAVVSIGFFGIAEVQK